MKNSSSAGSSGCQRVIADHLGDCSRFLDGKSVPVRQGPQLLQGESAAALVGSRRPPVWISRTHGLNRHTVPEAQIGQSAVLVPSSPSPITVKPDGRGLRQRHSAQWPPPQACRSVWCSTISPTRPG